MRSPGEYATGHIPHATSLPLFDDAERAVVGTTYVQQGRAEAIELGLEIVGRKMADYVRSVKPLVRDNKIYIHCWRGGMRSGSMAWLYDLAGYEVTVLRGGYKAYRHHVLEALAKPLSLRIIGGRTGSGKTELLQAMAARDAQIIDLEALACHRGSAFGGIGQEAQPRTEHYENLIHLSLSALDTTRPIWLEDESKSIGRCVIPDGLWRQMRQAPVYAIESPMEERITRLVRDYGDCPREELEAAIRAIERRLGNEAMKTAIQALHEGRLDEVVRITLRYYDRAYDKGLSAYSAGQLTRVGRSDSGIEGLADTLMTYK
ncbi:MAG: tRNA 2-selenouridine(34) synthase MnmH [Bacteroidetes bacterium]|nr:tRNA 2-selenouridine(34) synthase MnmH [Bacteroidota bacterium]